MKIYLIGITGAGKSTLGIQLALKLGYDFLDLDDFIISKQGLNIEEIFKHKGETYFRELEREAISEIDNENVVISTGGGAPCFFDNMDIMASKGKTIWLNPDAEIVADRLFNSENKTNRPMIQNKSKDGILDFVRLKLKERQPFYSRADIIIAHNNITAEMILDTLN